VPCAELDGLTELLGFTLEEAAVELAGLELAGLELAGVELAGLELTGVELAGLDVGATGVEVLVLVMVMQVVSPDSQVIVLVVTKQP